MKILKLFFYAPICSTRWRCTSMGIKKKLIIPSRHFRFLTCGSFWNLFGNRIKRLFLCNQTIVNQFGRRAETVRRAVWRHSRIHIYHWTVIYRCSSSKALFIPFDFFSRYFSIRFTDFVPFTPPLPHPLPDKARTYYTHSSSSCSFETVRYYHP